MPRLTVTVEYEVDYDSYIHKDTVDDYLPDVVNAHNLKKVTKVKIKNIKK